MAGDASNNDCRHLDVSINPCDGTVTVGVSDGAMNLSYEPESR